jgi:HEAT repeat protein
MNQHSQAAEPLLFRTIILVMVCALFANAQATASEIKAQPIYEQCKSLKTGVGPDDVTALLAALKEKDPRARAQAALGLGKTCDGRAVEALLVSLRDEDPMVRVAAIESVGRLGPPDAAEDLIELIEDKDWRVRMALISSLASFKNFRARNMVLNGVANPSGREIIDVDDMRVRCSAILTCNEMHDVSYSRKAIMFLYTLLESKHEPIRKLAAQTMYELKNTRNAPSEFAGILQQSRTPLIRRWAAKWIGEIGLVYGRPALEQAAALDADPEVRKIAAASLLALKNKTP